MLPQPFAARARGKRENPRAAVAEAILVIDQAATILERLRSELLAEVLEHDLPTTPTPGSCDHAWPGELDPDAVCERGCGLAYVDWSQ